MDPILKITESRRNHYRDDPVEHRKDAEPWKRIAEGAQTELEKWTESRRDRRKARPRSLDQKEGSILDPRSSIPPSSER